VILSGVDATTENFLKYVRKSGLRICGMISARAARNIARAAVSGALSVGDISVYVSVVDESM
jgi:hypothetical protein